MLGSAGVPPQGRGESLLASVALSHFGGGPPCLKKGFRFEV